MKKLFIIIFSLVFFHLQAQEINQIIIDPDLEREILIGEVDEMGMANPIFVENWEQRVEDYCPNKRATRKIKNYFKEHQDLSIVVMFATWCGDSKEQMPHFVKLCHKAAIENVSYYALSRKKLMPGMDRDQYKIELVPTFIVFRGGQEIGRIIETPQVSLEKDLWRILE